jgi:hypothetical protein
MEVTVIGCGPAGLAAAHAAVGLGAKVLIIAPKQKTPQNGPVTLQHPIPGISTSHPDGYVRQIVVGGSILDYRLKLYGDVNVNINGDVLRLGYDTWRVQEAYDEMWDRYHKLIEDNKVQPGDMEWIRRSCDLVVSSAPAYRLCYNGACAEPGCASKPMHEFRSVPIALKFGTVYPDQPDNTIIYNARQHEPWVRSSSIFGVKVTDYKPEDCPDADLIVQKPLGTNCDCHPKILRVGRYGKWHNLAWIDSAYTDTRAAIFSMQHQDEWESIK